jgi:tetratricopeptide (TPR) repeat protein
MTFRVGVLFTLLALPAVSRAGLYYSGEQLAELPSRWRGFLIDQRTLRAISMPSQPGSLASPARLRYQEEAARLEKAARTGKLSADDLADLGAIYIRLGEAEKAVGLLRQANRTHPNHFAIAANLGTAWQVQGDLQQAAMCLQLAVRLAPGKHQRAEEYHLKLVRLRLRAGRDAQGLDDLFGVHYVGEGGQYEPGKWAVAERKKLPAQAVAVVQKLALWLPADPRLLWQLAELAAVHGDIKSSAAMMDGCVTQFGLQVPELREHRRLMRAAADRLAANPTGHEKQINSLAARSSRPLPSKLATELLPPISATGVNTLPWPLLAETVLDRKHRPAFPKYLQELDGKQVTLTGFMQPIGEQLDQSAFLVIEYPVGCWCCEAPELTGMIYVELPEGRSATFSRQLVRITGRLNLNRNDPEDFLFAVRQAKVGGVD